MDNIVPSLFGITPEQLGQQRSQEAYAKSLQMAQLDSGQRGAAGLMQAGAAFRPAVNSMFGIADPEMERVKQQQELNSQLDLSSPEKMRQSAKMLLDKGFRNEAFGLSRLADKRESEMMQNQVHQAQIEEYKARALKESTPKAANLPQAVETAEYLASLDFQKGSPEWKEAVKNYKDFQPKDAVEKRSTFAQQLIDEGIQPGTPEFTQRMKQKNTADVAAKERVNINIPKENKPNIITDSAGNVTLLDNSGNIIKKIEGGGKPSATHEKTVAAKKQLGNDLDSAITNLESITKKGGLLDKATGSGAGAAVDASAAFFGQATPGAIAIAELKPIYDKVLKMVPRFEGPQSDKDTKSYEAAAGQLANPAVPNAQKKAAAAIILSLMKQRKSQFTSNDLVGTEIDTTIPASGWGKAVPK